MKKLTRARVVPIISANVSWLIFGNNGSELTIFTKVGKNQERPSQAFLARVEQLIDQIRLNTTVADQEMRDKKLGKRRL